MNIFYKVGVIYLFSFCFLVTSQFATANPDVNTFRFSAVGGLGKLDWKDLDQEGNTSYETDARFNIVGHIGNSFNMKDQFLYGFNVIFHVDSNDDYIVGDSAPFRNPGFALQWELGYRVGLSSNFSLDLIGNAEYEYFTRSENYKNSDAPSNSEIEVKQFDVFSARLGTGIAWQNLGWKHRFLGGVKYPITIRESIDSQTSRYTADIDLEPKGRISSYVTFSNTVSLGKITQLKIDIYYDAYRFDASEQQSAILKENSVATTVQQLRPEQAFYGVNAGVQWW